VARTHGIDDLDDVVQETMIRCYQNWSVLDPDRDVWPWLVVVARHVAADRARSRARRAHGEPIDLTNEATPEDAICAGEERRDVRHAFALLSAADRRVLALHHLDGVPTAALAAMTGRSDNAVRQHLYRARRRLADLYRATGSAGSGTFTTIAVQAGRLWRAVFRHAEPGSAAACLSVAALLCTGAAAAPAPAPRPVVQVTAVRAVAPPSRPDHPVRAPRVPSVTGIVPLRRLAVGPVVTNYGDVGTGPSQRALAIPVPGTDQTVYVEDKAGSGVVDAACSLVPEGCEQQS
jgi:RNA polymerase sigma-70 factor (ECF subfamily)